MSTSDPLSRRTFVAGAVAAGAARSQISAKSAARVVGANERLHVGVIGAGGNAMAHMRTLQKLGDDDNVEVVAVCDIYDPRREAAAALTAEDRTRSIGGCWNTLGWTTSRSRCRTTGTPP